MEDTLFLAKIHDDNRRISYYSKQILTLIQKEFRVRNISIYDYERLINILTCLDLQTEETRKDLDGFIAKKADKRVSIDLKI